MTRIHQAILKTLAYADIFNYPLAAEEIYKWIIKNQGPTLKEEQISAWLKSQAERSDLIGKTKSYYHLKNRQAIVNLRLQRARYSRQKLYLARRAARYLKLIPTIKLIALTGALAMNNSNQTDDIDLMIIAQTNHLWTTRIISILILELLHLRRRPHTQDLTNKICLNLFLDQSNLTLPLSQQNLYTAHEIAQAKPLLNRQSTYQQFLNANSWANQYLPHAFTITQPPKPQPPKTSPSLLEKFCYHHQHSYMKSKITREIITPHSAFFHPRPTSQIILKQYHQKLNTLNLK